MKTDIQDRGSSVAFSLDRPVAGLENGIGKFYIGLGPGPEGPQKPVPLLLQLLDAGTFDLGFKPGDSGYQVLSNDQNRFALPKALPPVLSLLQPGDDENPNGSHLVARYAYSEGAFLLLHDLLDTGFRFTLKDFLKLSQSLGEVLAFLHSQGIVHCQWNPRSILCIPDASRGSPFDDVRTYHYHVLNTGVRYHDPVAIPKEFLERGYFPRDIFSPESQLPDYEAYDLEADVYCLAACLKDIFQRASCFEELTTQAQKIRDHFHREAIRRGQEPTPERIRHKEQEILDHLYTFKVKTEEMIQSGLRDRGERSSAAALWEKARDLYRKTLEYADKLLEVGFGSINVFGEDLQRYIPYQIKLEPRFVNSFDDTMVTLGGADLPYEVVRLTLGEANRPLEVLEGTPVRIRFRVPPGFPSGEHQILINNQRTSQTLKVIAPSWKHVLPDRVRKPWPGFGNIVVRVTGRDFPSSPTFSLAPGNGAGSGCRKEGEPERAAEPPLEASLVRVETVEEELKAGFADERVRTEDEVCLVQFPPHAPVGLHPLWCKGLDTGLRLSIEDVLPDPVLDRDGISPVEVLNHREQLVRLRGKHFHETMEVDLGEAAPARVGLHFEGERSAVLSVPLGFPEGEYRVRLNRAETGQTIQVREPRWASLEPQRVLLGGRRQLPRDLVLTGQHLPPVDEAAGEFYRLRTPRGREVSQGVIKWEEVEPGTVHRIRLSPDLRRGSHRFFFASRETGLEVRVRRKLSRASRAAIELGAIVCLALAGIVYVERSRPTIERLDSAQVFNFGDAPVLISGERIGGIELQSQDGRKVREIAVRKVGEDPARKSRYSFLSTGIPPGTYRLVPRRGLLSGRPAATPLSVISPRFDLSPRVVNRLLLAELTLTSAGRYPLKDAKSVTLRLKAPAPADGGKEEKKEPGEGGTPGGSPPGGPAPAGPAALPEVPAAARAPASPQLPRLVLTLPALAAPAGASLVGPLLDGPAPEGGPGKKTGNVPGNGSARTDGNTSDGKAGETAGQDEQPPGGAPAVARELPLLAGGKIPFKVGTFTLKEEGEYEVLLGGVPLAAQYTTDLRPLSLKVVGPRTVSLGPNPVTLSEEGTIRLAWKGENPVPGVSLSLVTEGATEEIAHSLKPTPEGFEGIAQAGKFLPAWAPEGAKPEVLPGIAVEVYPPPRVLSVSPETVEPLRRVELTLKGTNLREARSITIVSASGTGEVIRLALDPERLRQEGGPDSEYRTEPLVFETGKYAVSPGDTAYLEVVEDCRKLLDAYRKDLSGSDRLLNCLSDRHAGEEVRRQAADVLFDQGLLAESLGLYRHLGDLKSRFRSAFVSLHLEKSALGREGPARFYPRPDDPRSDPYYRGATALGWISGQGGQPPADPAGTWDLDFVRGSLAADPRAAVESLELSIEKKKSAAAVKEITPFLPAQEALASARLRLTLSRLGEGDPVRVRDEIQKLFFDSPESYAMLPPPDRARACFFHGHLTLWTTLSEEKAGQLFQRGLSDGGASEHAALCRLYGNVLGTSAASEAQTSISASISASTSDGGTSGNSWEESFIVAWRHHRRVRETPNYNVLTEKYDFGSPLYPEERKASLDLHQAMKRLEAAPEPIDPFAHHSLLFSLRNAQRIAWPRQEGGLKAREHREKLLALKLEGEAAALRDFYILEAELDPLERAQLALLDWKEVQESMKKVGEILKGRLQEPVQARLRLLEKKLQRS